MQARRSPVWEPYYLALGGRGFIITAAFVALGRKLARVTFATLWPIQRILLESGNQFGLLTMRLVILLIALACANAQAIRSMPA